MRPWHPDIVGCGRLAGGRGAARAACPGVVMMPRRPETTQDPDRHLGSRFGSHRGPTMQIGWSEVCVLVTRCSKGSGSQQTQKYRSGLQELPCVTAGARQRRRSDMTAVRAAMVFDLGKQC